MLVSADDSVMVVDCESLNGTWALGSPEIEIERFVMLCVQEVTGRE